jgi:hypothetical protein
MNPCQTCRHFVEARGQERDHRNLMDFIDPSLNTYNNGMADERTGPSSYVNTILGNVDKLTNISEKRRSLEMTLAMQGGGTLPIVPEYFPHCAKDSKPGAYVLCQAKNASGQCPDWDARRGAAPAGGGSPWGGPRGGW